MTGDHFTPALDDLLDDPMTHQMMESDRVQMPTLIALLAEAQRRLREREPRD